MKKQQEIKPGMTVELGQEVHRILKFVKEATRFYGSVIQTLLPKRSYITYFIPRDGHKEHLEISTWWMGQELKREEYELAHREEREAYLSQLLKMGAITEKEYKECLPKNRQA